MKNIFSLFPLNLLRSLEFLSSFLRTIQALIDACQLIVGVGSLRIKVQCSPEFGPCTLILP